jgi:hypothetical protein
MSEGKYQRLQPKITTKVKTTEHLFVVLLQDDICKQVQEAGGLQYILDILRTVSDAPRKSEAQNIVVAASALGLLQQLGKSDANKEKVVELGAFGLIVAVLGRYHDSPAVLHQVRIWRQSLTRASWRHAKGGEVLSRFGGTCCVSYAVGCILCEDNRISFLHGKGWRPANRRMLSSKFGQR